MSILSNPQGTPERVWSLVAGLSAYGGKTSRSAYDGLLNPGYIRDGEAVRAASSLAANAHGAALSLNLVEAGREQATLKIDLPSSFTGFSDVVHDRLIALSAGDIDAPILEAYAWMAAESDKQGGLEWIYQLGGPEFADLANSALVAVDATGNGMNSTKLAPWRRWLAFLGLGITMPNDRNSPDYPSPAKRIVRELKRSECDRNSPLKANEFVALLAQRMPYLDRGHLFSQACQRIGHSPLSSRLSPLLSAALRDLHDGAALRLVPSGDAADRVRLSEDSAHPIDAFTTVVLFPGESV